ncbi:MAG: S1 RNA-binding domain-containing protein [Kiritimatiellae bacterium]|nr:S1 RNA-binding domain-containing protein [Kiritimatiellia bacterium]
MKDEKKFTKDDFAAMLAGQFDNYRNGFDPGEEVDAVVTAVDGPYVTLDVNAKREGLLPVDEVRSVADGKPRVKPGDTIHVIFSGMQDGAFIFSTRLAASREVDRSLADAYAQQMPVEGTVEKEVNGGYEVTVNGQRAFCPYSQISLFRQEGVSYAGEKFNFLISEYGSDERGQNLIVSRRALLEKEREKQKEELKEDLFVGMICTGKVTRIVDFGAFVDLGGAEGLIPLREISWERNVKPSDVLKEGDTVDVQIKELNWDADRISLSLRGAKGDPFEDAVKKFPQGTSFTGKVTKLERFGAFVQLVPGVEGLIPIGKLGRGRHLVNAREVLSEGQEVLVEIESVDVERRRFGLALVDERIKALNPGELTIGMRTEGIVESIQPFGVFVRLSEEKTGLLHISETGLPKGGNALAKMEQAFPLDSKLEVMVKGLDNGRISLTLPSKWEKEAQEAQDSLDVANWLADNKKQAGSLGSLGDAFSGLEL